MEMESNLMNAYTTAYKLSIEKLAQLDPVEISLNTACPYAPDTNSLSVKYMNTEYQVNCATGEVSCQDDNKVITTTVKVLLLHHLINAKIRPLTGKLISFKETPGGLIYYDTFYKRAIYPLIKSFSEDFAVFYKAVERLGGVKENYGNASVTLNILPLVPVTYVLWRGDEELPASGTILFDSSVTSYLPDEDMVLAASFGVYEMMAQSGK